MIDCLINLVGLKGCNDEPPLSGLYLNTLPGISIKQMQRIANSEQQNYLGVWEDMQENASAQLFADFKNYVNYFFKINCCAENCDINAIFCNYANELAVSYRYLLGVMLMTTRIYSERLNYFTTVGIDQAEDLRADFQVMYEKSMKNAVKSMPKEIIQDCYICTGGKISNQLDLP